MKRITMVITLCSLLVFTGCAKESHASENTVLEEFLQAYIAQDYETAATYISDDSKASYQALQSLIADEELNGIVLKHMSDLKYKVISTDLGDDTATVQLRIIYRNAGGAFMNAIGSMYVDASEGKLSNDSSETISVYIRELLLTHLNTELETMDRERTVSLVKKNDQWQIVMTEEFKNALSGNMLNAIEELELMGVSF